MPSLSDFRDPMSTINLKTMATAMKDLGEASPESLFLSVPGRQCPAA